MHRRSTGNAAALALLLGLSATTPAAGQGALTPFQERVRETLALPQRAPESRARDAEREPVKALGFCRMREDMRVVEFGPGAGWYTEILAPLLREKGELHIAARPAALARLERFLAQESMARVRKVPLAMEYDAARGRFVLERVDLGVTGVDLVISFREYHAFDPAGGRAFNKAVFDALKPGGLYCVKDHTRRHMEADGPENRRRVDPMRVVLEAQAGGLRLVAFADTFARADDELRYEVGRRSVSGNTDRFMLLFEKPR